MKFVHSATQLILLCVMFMASACGEAKVKYASDLERSLCGPSSCPGDDCLCVMGTNNTWYFNHTIGDLEECENERVKSPD